MFTLLLNRDDYQSGILSTFTHPHLWGGSNITSVNEEGWPGQQTYNANTGEKEGGGQTQC